MTNYIKTFFVAILLLFSVQLMQAQKTFDRAEKAYGLSQYNLAVELYQKAFSKLKKKDADKKNYVIYQLGQSYRLSGQPKKAVAQYKKAIKARYYEEEPLLYFYLAEILRFQGEYEEAETYYAPYLELVPDDSVAIKALASCQFSVDWEANPTRFEIEVMKKLNSRENEWAPRFFDNAMDALVFTSSREGATGKKMDDWTGQRFTDLFVSTQDKKGDWSTPVLFDESKIINSPSNEGEACFSPDGNTIYFTYCGAERKKQLGCQIYASVFDGTTWSEPELLVLSTDSTADCVHPFVTADEKTIYFTSNMEGGEGDLDLWYATRADKGSRFGDPINLGKNINTDGKEAFPFLHSDTTLYFSSTGHLGMGGYDLFKSVKVDNEWGEAENMKVPLNSSSDDFGIVFYPGENRGFFSSNRKGGRGGDDIYRFELPVVSFTISGMIRDASTLQPLQNVFVQATGTDGSSVRTKTNSRGMYRLDPSQIRQHVTYQLRVSKIDFLDQQAVETTVGLESSKDIVRDFSMAPVPKGPVVLPDILYDLGKWDLKPQYEDSLIDLIILLENNPRLVIELASHTDSRNIAMTNDSLSQYRAQSVVDYLILRGIHPGRLIAKGYGSRVPRKLISETEVTYNDQTFTFPAGAVMHGEFMKSLDSKEAQEAAHSLNRRTEFSILRDDFIPEESNATVESVVIIQDAEEDNSIRFSMNPTGNPEIPTIINGISFTFVYDDKAKENLIDFESAMKLLRIGKINIQDFKEKEKAFNEDSDVIINSTLTLSEVKIGKEVIRDVVVKVSSELPAAVLLNKATMDRLGNYQLDKNKLKLIIDN